MSKHDLKWLSTPKRLGFPSNLAWGWRTGCRCGWSQSGQLLGTKKAGVKDWKAHRDGEKGK